MDGAVVLVGDESDEAPLGASEYDSVTSAGLDG
jgi:hypothetical protein